MRLARLKTESANPSTPTRPAGTYYNLINRISGQPGVHIYMHFMEIFILKFTYLL